MRPSLRNKLWILLVYPVAVGYTPRSSQGETWLDILFGIGTIVDVKRGCNGNVISTEHLPYADGVIGATYMNDGFIASGHIGYTSVHPFDSSFANVRTVDNWFEKPFIEAITNKPYLTIRMGINKPGSSLIGGVTALMHETRGLYFLPSFSMRLGSETSTALIVNVLEPTLLASGMAIDVGVRGPLSDKTDGYAAMGIDLFQSFKLNTNFTFWNTSRTHCFIVGGGIGLDPEAAPWSMTFGYRSKL